MQYKTSSGEYIQVAGRKTSLEQRLQVECKRENKHRQGRQGILLWYSISIQFEFHASLRNASNRNVEKHHRIRVCQLLHTVYRRFIRHLRQVSSQNSRIQELSLLQSQFSNSRCQSHAKTPSSRT